MASGSGNVSGIEFGNARIVRPIGVHKATVVWLHDIGQTYADSARFVRQLGLRNIKWICPTGPKRPVTILGGMETTAWCDITEVSENMHDDVGSLHYATTFVANILSSEVLNIRKGIGGIGIGAAEALYLASCYAFDFERVPINPRVVIGLNGWLPTWRSLKNNMASNSEAANRALSLPILLTHSDDMVPYPFAHKCAHSLLMAGFPITLRKYQGEHNLNEVAQWLTHYLDL